MENMEQQPFWRRVGVFFAWSGAIGGGVSLITFLLVVIVSLFQEDKFANFALDVSNWLFWTFALLLFGGLIVPSENAIKDQEKEKRRPAITKTPTENTPNLLSRFQERRQKTMRKRIANVYNPWRWRFWMASLITLGICVLFGLLAPPVTLP